MVGHVYFRELFKHHTHPARRGDNSISDNTIVARRINLLLNNQELQALCQLLHVVFCMKEGDQYINGGDASCLATQFQKNLSAMFQFL
jgi:hypothetical protein